MGNQSSGPLSVCPTRVGEAMLEAAMQVERGAEGGGAWWRCAGGREPCRGSEEVEAGETGLELGFCQDYLNLHLCYNPSVLPVLSSRSAFSDLGLITDRFENML